MGALGGCCALMFSLVVLVCVVGHCVRFCLVVAFGVLSICVGVLGWFTSFGFVMRHCLSLG